MKLNKIRKIAEKYKNMFSPFCERLEIAGSIRRKKPEPKDIEFVAIPKGNKLDNFLKKQKFKYLKNGPKYKQIILPEGINLDLFLCTKYNFGNIYLIRTGNWKFSMLMMGIRTKYFGLYQKDGYLWKDGKRLICREEEDVFKLLKKDYVKPEDRNY